MTKEFIELDKTELENLLNTSLPPIIARAKVADYTGGYYSPGTLANEDSKGTGPRNPICGEGGKVAYMKPYFIEWLLAKSRIRQTANK